VKSLLHMPGTPAPNKADALAASGRRRPRVIPKDRTWWATAFACASRDIKPLFGVQNFDTLVRAAQRPGINAAAMAAGTLANGIAM